MADLVRVPYFLAVVFILLGVFTQGQPTGVAIQGVTVVDVTDGSLLPEQTVLIESNRIISVGPSDGVEVPDTADIVEATGKYLIPGLWDMHHSPGAVGTNPCGRF